MGWRFWIDVGGTFTDCLGITPDGELRQFKTLSSGIARGQARVDSDAPYRVIAPERQQDPEHFWDHCEFVMQDPTTGERFRSQVLRFESASGTLSLAEPCPFRDGAMPYEIHTDLPAPVLGIRWLLGLAAGEPCPAVSVRLGTTRGTNALLTRTGARTVLATTAGFADAPQIGDQTRPELFAVDIRKPGRLHQRTLEVTERINAQGDVILPVEQDSLVSQLQECRADGFDSLAVCLMNAWTSPVHEEAVAASARAAGFEEISLSSEVSPQIRFVSRCDTTCLDAYLNPVLRQYLAAIQEQLPGSQIQLMTSAGGLVDQSAFRGRDCLLSGPAGGIVGFSAVAQRAGFERAIGFDMGGTSTDVARFDGGFEYESETLKAGVRVMSSMLAIETVAAGGGSICGFDGVSLTVGPQSAGADPGPACYGAGGPLTVTDLNVFLGRLPSEHFPFPLDTHAVGQRITQLLEEVRAASTEHSFAGPEALAEALLAIANDNMVQAIRRISVARGYDPADYVLVCFGGAGGQHACSVARALGIRQVLIHPLAGVLSAWGIGQADIRSIIKRTAIVPLTAQHLSEQETLFQEMEQQARADVLKQGVSEQFIDNPQRSLALRYTGTDSSIDAVGTTVDELTADFEQQHRRLYGYVQTNRRIEIAGVRVEVVGRSDSETQRPRGDAAAVSEHSAASDDLVAQTVIRTRTVFNGRRMGATVYPRSAIQPGDQLVGPSVICEPTSTIVIEPGCEAEIDAEGTVRITVDEGQTEAPEDATLDRPVLAEVLTNQLTSIAEQMGATLRRTAISTNVRERLDYSCALFDSSGSLIVNAPHVPVHLGAMSETVRAIVADHPDMKPGDVFVTNDPSRGGSHLPDITVVTPVFLTDEDSAASFFVANRAHHAELGGAVPGSMPPFSKTLAEEGVLIRSCHLVEQGQSREAQIRTLLQDAPYPSRAPDENLADLAAQAASNACGSRLLMELCTRYSAETVAHGMQRILETSATKMRHALSSVDDGVRQFSDTLDDGTPLCVTISIADGAASVDFTGSADVHSGNLNANRAITHAAVLYTFRCLLNEEVPLNSGMLEPLSIHIPPGILSPEPQSDGEKFPAIAGGNVETSQRIVDVLFGALGLAAASQGTMNNLTFGNAQFGYYETLGGGSGASDRQDGADAVQTHMTNTRMTDPEVLEQKYPVRVRQFGIRADSGGGGRHTGGCGLVREIEFLQPMTVSMLSQRRTKQPWGLEGGLPGAPGRNLRLRPDGTVEDLGGAFSITVDVNDILRVETPGGGGYGSPQ